MIKKIISHKSDSLLQDAQQIIETARNFAYKAVNNAIGYLANADLQEKRYIKIVSLHFALTQ